MIYPYFISIMLRLSLRLFLGNHIYENLTWKHHIEDICNKVSERIGIMYKYRHILNKRPIKQLYFLVIHAELNYANITFFLLKVS